MPDAAFETRRKALAQFGEGPRPSRRSAAASAAGAATCAEEAVQMAVRIDVSASLSSVGSSRKSAVFPPNKSLLDTLTAPRQAAQTARQSTPLSVAHAARRRRRL